MKNKDDRIATLVAVGFVVAICVASLSAVDYFANGCIVGDRYLVTTEVRPGVSVTKMHTTAKCHQYFIKTKRGQELQNF
jgi:hypothetical protein